jgi:hypothetical protein
MMATMREVKTLSIMLDHKNFLQVLRSNAIVPIPSKYMGDGAAEEKDKESDELSLSSLILSVAQLEGEDEEDGDIDNDFYDNDYDAKDDDDDMFLDNIDKDVNDNNECTEIV